MQPIFTTSSSNDYPSLVLCNSKDGALKFVESFNREALANNWCSLDFKFDRDVIDNNNIPDICTVYVSGILAFKPTVAEALFPKLCAEIEFLPIVVSNEKWLLLNCLKTSSRYDRESSIVLRDADQIFWIQKILVTDPTVEACELFTIEDSNRTVLCVLPSFRSRVESLELTGLAFREIGSYVPQQEYL